MKRAIVSYPIKPGLNAVAMPVDARVVAAGGEGPTLRLFVRVRDPQASLPGAVVRHVLVIAENEEFPDERPWAYVACVLGDSHRGTLHVLERAS